jgi:hypothetical protein
MESPEVQKTRCDLAADLNDLPKMPIADLRKRWRELFANDPPPAFGPDLLRRSVAQKLQEDAFGGLPPATRRLLNQLVNSAATKPNGRIELPQRIKSGAVLIREWKSKTHRVTVLDNGFAYEGRTYEHLSRIAREITGTRWNGPRFFGLRKTEAGRGI